MWWFPLHNVFPVTILQTWPTCLTRFKVKSSNIRHVTVPLISLLSWQVLYLSIDPQPETGPRIEGITKKKTGFLQSSIASFGLLFLNMELSIFFHMLLHNDYLLPARTEASWDRRQSYPWPHKAHSNTGTGHAHVNEDLQCHETGLWTMRMTRNSSTSIKSHGPRKRWSSLGSQNPVTAPSWNPTCRSAFHLT